MKDTILFDLGNTLVEYWSRDEFPHLLEEAIGQVQSYLRQQRLLTLSSESFWQRVQEEKYFKSGDHRVHPLEGRLARIFDLDESTHHMMPMCRAFMDPLFAKGRLYDDSIPTLERLREQGFTLAIVSNTPRGSPSSLWREEVARLGLADKVDIVVFCGDVGWRKPARQIFDHTLALLDVTPERCVFVGDDPRWDIVGPRALGIDAILIDRSGTNDGTDEEAIHRLDELWSRLQRLG